MKLGRLLVTPALFLALLFSNVLPCGPGYTTPLFDTSSAPEDPYSDYAAGRLGIVKPTFRRSVLLAAYRWLSGNGLTPDEQRAMIDAWKAEIDNKDFADNTVDDAVRAWVEKRKEVMAKEEKPPEIYAERNYGGYEFFPNCTKNAFETAAQTLTDRVSAHGPSDAGVVDWVTAQDEVFGNCSVGKQTPDDPPAGSPDWLQKDRAYQKAAAEFYSLNYVEAKKRFEEIARDFDSPWQETANYLVARTLIRQASLTKDAIKSAALYDEAEEHLSRRVAHSGKFADSVDRLLGLIAYRRHPQERVVELGRKLSIRGGNDNFRQDVIDYNWLLDKFASEALTAEEKRKQEEDKKLHPEKYETNTDANSVSVAPAPNSNSTVLSQQPHGDDDLDLYLYADNNSYHFYVRAEATDEEAIAAAEKTIGRALADAEKVQVRSARQTAYAGRFSSGTANDYQGGYFGEEKLTPSIVPAFLHQNELTDWTLTYQMSGAQAYLYSLGRYKATGSQLWLMTALSQADNSSTDLKRLIDAADRADRSSAAYPTIAYHETRLLLAQGKQAEARRLIDETLGLGDTINTSTRNSFMTLRLGLAQTLEDFLRDSLLKPYAFDFDGETGTIEEFIAEQKKWYDPEVNKDGREAFEREIEDSYKDKKLWQERQMFDAPTIEVFNQHFSTVSLIEVMNSPALPDYMRERFVLAVWTRAYLLGDAVTLNKMSPELIKYHPEFEATLGKAMAARTPAARDNALLFFVLKNPILNPYLPDGMGRTDNEQDQWADDNWWCAPYDTEYDDATASEVPIKLPKRPAFLTAQQSRLAQTERKKLSEIGDAPKYLADKVMAWAKRSPLDRRVPEALYIVIEANGWTKYGCGNNEELRDEMSKYLRTRYPGSEWIKKLDEEAAGN
jgi:hypothetical protein